MTHQEFARQQQLKAAEVAAAVLEGKESHLGGARSIVAFLRAAEVPSDDTDFSALFALDSQSDELPIGEVRSLWSPEALRRIDPELVAAENHAKEHYGVYFANIARRFGPSNQPLHPTPTAAETPASGAGERRR